MAQARGLTIRGTLGVLVQARQAHLLPALKPVLDALIAEGFRIAPALVREALAHVDEVGYFRTNRLVFLWEDIASIVVAINGGNYSGERLAFRLPTYGE